MSTASPRLKYGVPAPFAFEAPSSWLSRLAVAQGCSLVELLEFLGLVRGSGDLDLDLEMHGETLANLRHRCSLPLEAFAIAGRVIAGFHQAGLIELDLVSNLAGAPGFRFCPLCLRQRRVPYLDIQWRFVDWRYCPEHNCLMEHACWQCSAPLLHPHDMAESAAGLAGHASQSRCQSCAADLAAATPCMVDPVSSTTITELEACWLLNGRALLAALCSGRADYRSEGVGTAAIGARAHAEWLPSMEVWEACDRRIRRGPHRHQGAGSEELPRLPYFFHELTTRWGTVLTLERTKLAVEDLVPDSETGTVGAKASKLEAGRASGRSRNLTPRRSART